jgi:hypothetical protein
MARGIFGRVEAELESRNKSPGLSMLDVLEMPETLRGVVQWLMRHGAVPAAEIAAHTALNETAVRELLAPLIEKGDVIEFELKGKMAYRVRLAAKRKRDATSDIWQALNDKIEQ